MADSWNARFGKSAAEVTFRDIAENTTPCRCLGTCCCSVILFTLTMLFLPASVQLVHYKRVGLLKNTVSGVVDLETTHQPGRYYPGFWKKYIEFPTYLQTIEFSNEKPEAGVELLGPLQCRDQEGKRMFLDLSLQYRLLPEKIGQLYREMQTNYEDVFISALRDALSKVGNRFVFANLWENYSQINTMMKQACVDVLSVRHAECWDLQIWGVNLEDRFDDALVKTQARKQAQMTEEARKLQSGVRARTQAILAEYTRNLTVVKSQGQAKKFEIEQRALVTAESRLLEAQAAVLALIRNIVVVNGTGRRMNDTELVTYQQLMMLRDQAQANFVYSGGPVEPVNLRAIRQMGAGDDRRLLEL